MGDIPQSKLEALAKDPKLTPFNVHQTSFTKIGDHSVACEVHIPKTLETALAGAGDKKVKRGIILRFHGGGFIGGMSLWPDWIPQYLLDFAELHSTPIISADHRLMPECNGMDILEDLGTFWAWVVAPENGLRSYVASLGSYPNLELDVDRILAEGESAGGYLVVQAALSGLPGLKAVISAYPMLDLRDRYYCEKFEKIMTGVPMQPVKILEDHLASMKPGDVATRALPPARMALGNVIIQQGLFCKYFGDEDMVYPVDRVRKGMHVDITDKPMPRLWIYHGKHDTGIPSIGSIVFVDAVNEKKLWPTEELRFDRPDGEHSLHYGKRITDTPWLKEGLAWLEKPFLE